MRCLTETLRCGTAGRRPSVQFLGGGAYCRVMQPQLTKESLDGLFRAFELETIMSAEEYDQGVAELESELRRLGLDADAAQIQQLAFSRAVLDFDNYPFLARFHAYVDNFLTLSLPPPLLLWLCRAMSRREEMEAHFEMLSEGLVRLSASSRGPMQALAKFVLFEMVRLELVLHLRRYPRQTFRQGFEIDHLSYIAEGCVETWLKESPPDDVRSLPILMEAARRTFASKADELKMALVGVKNDLLGVMLEEQERRGLIEEELSLCEPKVSLLVRNAMPETFKTPSLSMEELRSRHRFILGTETVEAMYKRSQRMMKRGEIPKRKGVALLDFVRMLDGEEAIR